MKRIKEKRNDKHARMGEIIDLAKKEERAFTDSEKEEFENLRKEIENLDATLLEMEKYTKANVTTPAAMKNNDDGDDIRAFADVVRGVVNLDAPIKKGDNGVLIPKTIANKIIEEVNDISPIYNLATKYNVKGKLIIPYINESGTTLEMKYADEFEAAPEGTTMKTEAIELDGFLARVLTKISKSLLNNTDFDLVNIVISRMAKAVAEFIEKECINGTGGKIDGLKKGVKNEVKTRAATAVTSDELIDLQEAVPDIYQGGAVWIMNRETRKAIRKLKDGDGTYLLEQDFTSKWGYTLLGKPVYTTDSVEKIGSAKTIIYYGDMSGLAVKIAEDINLTVLHEKYAEQHAVGVVGFVELDAKVENAQKIAKLTCAN